MKVSANVSPDGRISIIVEAENGIEEAALVTFGLQCANPAGNAAVLRYGTKQIQFVAERLYRDADADPSQFK